ncbi:hypothetical protein EIN_425400 [Entamoeba invadens IP1]|uniref:Uncharacterized protein n=1 Tax=Entamoeba invadens IP1 TaxID=370355 RepID=A0A0A1U600_ENTIV|nr:hypothetical protein EIN_425400 [Entamoeba invadens IP1]ELP89808.1 hypothetical protein EIN_425400 [Entamoeba invadens IP1]|eukprot:XP_004256579.1 hypothetical protein EIN_425400 [Entamoeba invadens IP1]
MNNKKEKISSDHSSTSNSTSSPLNSPMTIEKVVSRFEYVPDEDLSSSDESDIELEEKVDYFEHLLDSLSMVVDKYKILKVQKDEAETKARASIKLFKEMTTEMKKSSERQQKLFSELIEEKENHSKTLLELQKYEKNYEDFTARVQIKNGKIVFDRIDIDDEVIEKKFYRERSIGLERKNSELETQLKKMGDDQKETIDKLCVKINDLNQQNVALEKVVEELRSASSSAEGSTHNSERKPLAKGKGTELNSVPTFSANIKIPPSGNLDVNERMMKKEINYLMNSPFRKANLSRSQKLGLSYSTSKIGLSRTSSSILSAARRLNFDSESSENVEENSEKVRKESTDKARNKTKNRSVLTPVKIVSLKDDTLSIEFPHTTPVKPIVVRPSPAEKKRTVCGCICLTITMVVTFVALTVMVANIVDIPNS